MHVAVSARAGGDPPAALYWGKPFRGRYRGVCAGGGRAGEEGNRIPKARGERRRCPCSAPFEHAGMCGRMRGRGGLPEKTFRRDPNARYDCPDDGPGGGNAQFRRALTGESVQADENSVWDKRWLNWCVFCFYTSGEVWGQIQFLLISSRRCTIGHVDACPRSSKSAEVVHGLALGAGDLGARRGISGHASHGDGRRAPVGRSGCNARHRGPHWD
jgi:hypothetical protein